MRVIIAYLLKFQLLYLVYLLKTPHFGSDAAPNQENHQTQFIDPQKT